MRVVVAPGASDTSLLLDEPAPIPADRWSKQPRRKPGLSCSTQMHEPLRAIDEDAGQMGAGFSWDALFASPVRVIHDV